MISQIHFRMKQISLIVLLIAINISSVTAQSDKKDKVDAYIKKYRAMAIMEQKRSGVPASITLAQGIHETNAGASELAVNANNHFGIKCKKEWTGETYTYTDDRPDECFRKYSSDKESYKDHSDYLKNSKRYETLFALDLTDYKGWCHGLKRCGYATNPRYAQILIKTIEDNNLNEYTLAALSNNNPYPLEAPAPSEKIYTQKEIVPVKDAPQAVAKTDTVAKKRTIVSDGDNKFIMIRNAEKPAYGQTVIVNGLKAFYAPKDAGLLSDAIKYKMHYTKLLELNDLPDKPLEADMFIYLEKKNTRGSSYYHVVRPNETMLQIAQMEGMQLKVLRQLNKLKENEEPVSGSLIHLQELTSYKPQVVSKQKEEKRLDFEPEAVPQGATRKRSGYISKREIEEGSDKEPVKAEEPTFVTTKTATTKSAIKTIEEQVVATPVTPTEKEEKTFIVKIDKAPDTVAVASQSTDVVKEAPTTIAIAETKATTETDDEVIVKKQSDSALVIQPITTTPVQTIATPEPTQPILNTEIKEPEKVVVETVTKEAEKEEAVVKEEQPAPPPPTPVIEEPKDEYDRLKARLDKAVYASGTTTKPNPTNTAPATPTPAEKATVNKEEAQYYTVQKGDNAFGIAKKHNITMAQLKALNELDFSEIKVGQKLRVK